MKDGEDRLEELRHEEAMKKLGRFQILLQLCLVALVIMALVFGGWVGTVVLGRLTAPAVAAEPRLSAETDSVRCVLDSNQVMRIAGRLTPAAE